MIIEKEDQDSVSRCSICNKVNTTITDPNSGEIICSNCGMVISDKIEDTIHPERRMHTFEDGDKNARTGAPSSLARHDMGLSTIIGKENKDASGQKIDTAYALQTRKTKDIGFQNTYVYFWGQKFCEGFWATRKTKGKTKLIRCHSRKGEPIYIERFGKKDS